MSWMRWAAGAAAVASCVVVLAACSPSPEVVLDAGESGGSSAICVGDFSQPITHAEPFELSEGVQEVTLIRADLVDADGVRVIEQAAARAVPLADGTHLGVGTNFVAEDDEAWDGRIPLEGAAVRNDGGETWFVALALERTEDTAGGFTAVDLTYEVNGHQRVVRGTESMTFPAVGGTCR